MTLPGVVFIDHTADVGIDVNAASLEELLHRAALGMMALLRGEEEGAVPSPPPSKPTPSATTPAPAPQPSYHPIALRSAGLSRLMAEWLGEILFLHEVRGVDYVDSELERTGPDGLGGRLLTRPGGGAVREIKGVTYHELEVTRGDAGGWRARVIFDV